MTETIYKIMPLGGVGEIGSNMTVLRLKERTIIFDIGILFPYDNFYNIDYLIPDFYFLKKENVTDLVLTHAHEDHVGAIVHLLREFPDINVHCSNFCASMIRKKLEEDNIAKRFSLFKENSVLKFDNVLVHPIHVTHSIPETFGFVIQDEQRKLATLFMSDFKYDLNPAYERPFNKDKIKNLFKECKNTVALIDSTNIMHKGKTQSEKDLIPGINKVVKNAKGRIFVTLFSSNIFRMQSFINAAIEKGYKISSLGRSVSYSLKNAREQGVLVYDQKLYIEPDNIEDKNKILVFISGCQGDHFSALKRLGYGEHGSVKLRESDTIIFSSKVIPGNEKTIARLYNKITESNAHLVTSNDENIHASGHPSQEDLKLLLNEIRPQTYIPIHGETYFIKKQIDFIQAQFPEIKTRRLANFKELIFQNDGEIKTDEHFVKEPLLIHGNKIVIERNHISTRRKMAICGVVIATFNQKNHTGQLDFQGLPEFANEFKPHLFKLLKENLSKKGKDKEEDLRIMARRFLNSKLGYKPITFVYLV